MRRLKRLSKKKNFFFAKIFAKTCVLVVVLNADMQYMYLNFASEYLHEKVLARSSGAQIEFWDT